MEKNLFPLILLLSIFVVTAKTIIDEILIYSNHIVTFLHYFSCVDKVFTEYRLSLELSKCYFFLPCIEYNGHDLIAGGNGSDQSKFKLVKE